MKTSIINGSEVSRLSVAIHSTKLTEDKVKKLIRKIKTDCFVSDRDYLGLL
ncbi:hypothetical protein AE23_05154, partial [Klebsiella pneumoniae UCI 64]